MEIIDNAPATAPMLLVLMEDHFFFFGAGFGGLGGGGGGTLCPLIAPLPVFEVFSDFPSCFMFFVALKLNLGVLL